MSAPPGVSGPPSPLAGAAPCYRTPSYVGKGDDRAAYAATGGCNTYLAVVLPPPRWRRRWPDDLLLGGSGSSSTSAATASGGRAPSTSWEEVAAGGPALLKG